MRLAIVRSPPRSRATLINRRGKWDAVRRVLALVLAGLPLLAGCVLAPGDQQPGGPAPEARASALVDVCANVWLWPSSESFHAGENVTVLAHVENCDAVAPLSFAVGAQCPFESGFAPIVNVERLDFALPREGDPARAATPAAACRVVDAPIRTLAPGEIFEESFAWNGRVASDDAGERDVEPGPYGLFLQVHGVTGWGQSAFAEVTVLARGEAWPSEIMWHRPFERPFVPPPCARVWLLPERDAFRAGENASVTARVENCDEGRNLTFGGGSLCGHENGLVPVITVGGRSFSLSTHGGAARENPMCLALYVPPRVVSPGEAFEARYSWNGALSDSSGSFHASPGVYRLELHVSGHEGWGRSVWRTLSLLPADAPAPPALRTLDVGSWSGISERARLVIEDEAAWRAFWFNHTSGTLPHDPAPPPVDFSVERVVVALDGDKPDSCYAIRVAGAARDGPDTIVRVVSYLPPRESFCGLAITQPVHVVAIPQDGSRVRFEDSESRAWDFAPREAP